MKKITVIFISCLILYTSYLDLTRGTLNMLESSSTNHVGADIAFQTVTIQPGETVLSALEKLNGTLPVSIEQAIQDFKTLNPSIDPMMIQAGHTYKFPLYSIENK